MRGRVAWHAEVLAFLQPILVLGMKGGTARDGAENRFHPGIVGDQQAAGGRAHEHLYAGATGQLFEHRQFGDVLMRAADIEGEVAMHAASGAGNLVLEGFPRGG